MKKLDTTSVPLLSAEAMKQISKFAITPEAAFLLSRVDGRTDLGTIAFMANFDVAKTIALLQPLLDQGVLTLPETETAKAKEPKKVGSILDLLEHEETDARYAKLPREFRREVLLLFSRLGEMSLYDLLETKRKEPASKVKEQYFKMSKKFHPDRYFSKDIGHYKSKINKIFEKLSLAFATLSDEKKRKEYDSTLDDALMSQLKKGEVSAEQAASENPVVANLNRARRYYEWGEEDYMRGNYVSAASNYLLAKNFDPTNEEYQRAHDRVKPFVERKKLKETVIKAMARVEMGEYDAAYRMLKQLSESNPQFAAQDGDFLLKISRVGLMAGVDASEAAGYNKKAEALVGETAYGQFTKGLLAEKKGSQKAAVAAYRRGLELDPEDQDLQKALKRLQEKVRE